ncbi:hypothetical protein CBS101457_002625 [Exobasidium rhododendri]|nr:hypothetical protein CBS101457_002625 [Exobasidium rhododendri]
MMQVSARPLPAGSEDMDRITIGKDRIRLRSQRRTPAPGDSIMLSDTVAPTPRSRRQVANMIPSGSQDRHDVSDTIPRTPRSRPRHPDSGSPTPRSRLRNPDAESSTPRSRPAGSSTPRNRLRLSDTVAPTPRSRQAVSEMVPSAYQEPSAFAERHRQVMNQFANYLPSHEHDVQQSGIDSEGYPVYSSPLINSDHFQEGQQYADTYTPSDTPSSSRRLRGSRFDDETPPLTEEEIGLLVGMYGLYEFRMYEQMKPAQKRLYALNIRPRLYSTDEDEDS